MSETPATAASETLVTHQGGCHCGAVRYEVDAPASLHLTRCTCSICSMSGFLHLIVPAERFRLLEGETDLTEYRFNTRIARHLFCRHCGVKSFYVPRSHPDGFSVNANCLDRETIREVTGDVFDGAHWEQNIDAFTAND